MSIKATIINATTGEAVQKHVFGRMPTLGTPFNLETGERVSVQRIEVGKPAAGSFVTPVTVWFTPKA